MIRVTLFILASVLSFSSIKAQKEKDNVSILKAGRLAKAGNGNVLTLEGNVALSTQRLIISRADKVVFDEALKKLVIYGAAEYSFDGKVTAAMPNERITRLEYSLGEDTLYLK